MFYEPISDGRGRVVAAMVVLALALPVLADGPSPVEHPPPAALSRAGWAEEPSEAPVVDATRPDDPTSASLECRYRAACCRVRTCRSLRSERSCPRS